MRAFVLVHSPLVGPATWRWVAETLARRGHRVTVPAASPATGWEDFADSVAAQIGNHSVLVGHSGAGPLLPQIAARATADALVFVDAGVPPEVGTADLMPPEMLADLRATASDGVLPPWSDWYGEDVMAELIPDRDRRGIVTAELPRLPLRFFEEPVPVPLGWAATRCGYIQLSEAYAEDAARAAGQGWPVIERQGAHLDIVTRPVEIADAILDVTRVLAS